MRRARVPIGLRRRVAEQAGHRCGYCLTPEALTGAAMEVEHVIPAALGGETVEANLWLSCRRCNSRKGLRTHARDPLSQEEVPLYNPRTQTWSEHFAWSQDGTSIIGRTAVGRATIDALDTNDRLIVAARGLWVQGGWWPPDE
jgi:hypothetical protein